MMYGLRSSLRPSPQDPTTCQALSLAGGFPLSSKELYSLTGPVQCQIIDVPPLSTCRPTFAVGPGSGPLARPVLLRKEVIQPHLPVRLPCYDLVPIASPTFDGSLHEGWATGFGCYRLS